MRLQTLCDSDRVSEVAAKAGSVIAVVSGFVYEAAGAGSTVALKYKNTVYKT